MATTQVPQARSVAQEGVRPPAGPAETTIFRRRRPGYLGAVNVVQIMLLEAVLFAVLFALRHTVWILLAGAIGGLLLLLAAFGRRRGRWWTEYMVLRTRFRRRSSSGPVAANDHRLAVLQRLVPDLTVQDVEGAAGTQVGVGSDGAGWFAVVAVSSGEGMTGAPPASVPLGALARVVKEAEQPGTVVQVVTHTVPAPSALTDGTAWCSRSYEELLRPIGGSAPADQISWLTIRLDARTLAEATVGGTGSPVEPPVIVASLVRLAVKALRRTRLTCHVLHADGILDALVRSLDLDPAGAGTRAWPREHWQRWDSAKLVHACFWLQDWPPAGDGGSLLGALARTQSAFTSVATILQPGDDGADLRCIVRVAADAAALEGTCTRLREAAESAGARLFRLDGEQALAVYASAPSGGGPL
jgi:type VII secretion protein EccE